MTMARSAPFAGAPATDVLGTASVFLAATMTSADGSSRRPTSAAQAARATICEPGKVAPTGLPGLIANETLSLGQERMSCTNRTLTEVRSLPTRAARCSDIRSGDVKTQMNG